MPVDVRFGSLVFLVACAVGSTAPSVPPTTAGTTSLPVPACTGSVPIPFPDGTPSGYERCDDDRIHRVSAEPVLPPGLGDSCTGQEQTTECALDADCGSGELCRNVSYYGERCSCEGTCADDADCSGDPCVGPGAFDTAYAFATCVWSDCVTDADCASGLCGLGSYNNGCGRVVALACRTEADGCSTTADCVGGETCELAYEGNPAYVWKCVTQDCVVR